MYYGYIYKTTCLVNNKIYVGQHKWPGPNIDTKYFGSGKIIKAAIELYGKENFICEALEWCQDRTTLDAAEKLWIDALNARDNTIGYNIRVGGNSFDTAKIALTQSGRIGINNAIHNKFVYSEDLQKYLTNGWQLGTIVVRSKKILCLETGEIFNSLSMLSRAVNMPYQNLTAYYLDRYPISSGKHYCYLSTYEHWTEQQRANFLNTSYEDFVTNTKEKQKLGTSNAAKLRKNGGNNLAGKRFMNNGVDCVCVEESEFGRYFAEGYVLGRITSQKAHENMSKQIYCEELDTIFYSMTEASKATGAQISKISCCCHGTRKTANKLHFRFVNDSKQRGQIK